MRACVCVCVCVRVMKKKKNKTRQKKSLFPKPATSYVTPIRLVSPFLVPCPAFRTISKIVGDVG